MCWDLDFCICEKKRVFVATSPTEAVLFWSPYEHIALNERSGKAFEGIWSRSSQTMFLKVLGFVGEVSIAGGAVGYRIPHVSQSCLVLP